MQSWRLLQLEPSALREPDSFTAPAELGVDGAHLPATLFHLANGPGVDSEAVYAEVANRVSQLIGDVRSVYVDREERRQLLTLYAIGADKTAHPARALSDGTLRFLALTVLSLDPNAQGVICMEEPENGIHVERIPAMLELLQDLTADVTEDDGDEETGARLRQVIVNTHSPSVVLQVPDESLIYADAAERRSGDATIRALRLRCLPGTWRTQDNGGSTIPKGVLLAYLNPVGRQHPARRPRVVDRQDLQQYLLPFPGAAS
ncbi:MAG: AAA family ATPase [Bryobacterales bacterium]|nr:AAA family ATPase [Bryobacterales bacterium]